MFNQERLAQYWPVSKQGWPASRPIAADEHERQTSRRNDLRDGTDIEATDVDVENRQIEFRGAGQRFGRLNATRLGNYSMPKLLQHLDDHHPDQGFIFNQKYRLFGTPCDPHWSAA